MNEYPLDEQSRSWQAIVDELSRIRESGEYQTSEVELIRQELAAEDARIRGAACLAATGCLFEPHILDQMVEIVEYDPVIAIRKAAIRSMSEVIEEGVRQGFEDDAGADTQLDYAEEWEEYQSGSLREEYLRVKNLLMNILFDEMDEGLIEVTVSSLSDLGYISDIRDKILELYESDVLSSRMTALRAMGKFPHFWEDEIADCIAPETPTDILKEAISAGYASGSQQISDAVEGVLTHDDAEVLRFALLTLCNIDLSPNLADICRHFRNHPNADIQQVAQEGINRISRQNLGDFMRDSLGFEE